LELFSILHLTIAKSWSNYDSVLELSLFLQDNVTLIYVAAGNDAKETFNKCCQAEQTLPRAQLQGAATWRI